MTEPIILLLQRLPIILGLIVYKHFVPTGLRPLPQHPGTIHLLRTAQKAHLAPFIEAAIMCAGAHSVYS